MVDFECWAIENYEYRSVKRPADAFSGVMTPHNHSNHSIETMGFLNQVIRKPFMRPWKNILQASFGLAEIENLNYSDIFYRSPLSAENVLFTEHESARTLGFERILVGITDHDEVSGSQELQRIRPDEVTLNPLGEELSVYFDRYLFHLGVLGLPSGNEEQLHLDLQRAAREKRLDDLFEILHGCGALVIFNHPLVPWGEEVGRRIPAPEFLQRYGWAIHALEYNGMRSRQENDAVLQLAKLVGKPVIGGGDSHLLMASSVLSLTQAKDFQEFSAEVKEGRAVPLILPTFFAPLGWKLFLRVLYFMGHYRRIGHFRGEPVREMLRGRVVLLDPVGFCSRAFLSAADMFRLIR